MSLRCGHEHACRTVLRLACNIDSLLASISFFVEVHKLFVEFAAHGPSSLRALSELQDWCRPDEGWATVTHDNSSDALWRRLSGTRPGGRGGGRHHSSLPWTLALRIQDVLWDEQLQAVIVMLQKAAWRRDILKMSHTHATWGNKMASSSTPQKKTRGLCRNVGRSH